MYYLVPAVTVCCSRWQTTDPGSGPTAETLIANTRHSLFIQYDLVSDIFRIIMGLSLLYLFFWGAILSSIMTSRFDAGRFKTQQCAQHWDKVKLEAEKFIWRREVRKRLRCLDKKKKKVSSLNIHIFSAESLQTLLCLVVLSLNGWLCQVRLRIKAKRRWRPSWPVFALVLKSCYVVLAPHCIPSLP